MPTTYQQLEKEHAERGVEIARLRLTIEKLRRVEIAARNQQAKLSTLPVWLKIRELDCVAALGDALEATDQTGRGK